MMKVRISSLGCVIAFIFISFMQLAWAQQPTLQKVDVKTLEGKQVQLRLTFSAPIKEALQTFVLYQPQRLVIDIPDATSSVDDKVKLLKMGFVDSYVLAEADNKLRLMITLDESVAYALQQSQDKRMILVNIKPSANTQQKTQERQTTRQITNVHFERTEKNGSLITLDLTISDFTAQVRREGSLLLVTLPNTVVPGSWRKQFDAKDFGTQVDTFTLTQQAADTVLSINARQPYEQSLYQLNKKLLVEVSPKIEVPGTVTLSESSAAYAGQRITLNFQDVSVRAVLQLLAEFTGINIVASDSVQGNLTLRLSDIPWDHALEIILQTRGLDKRQVGNVMIVAPAAEIAAREREALQARQQVVQLEPLQSELIQVNYAKAAEIAALLKTQGSSLLSERGQVSVDARTNTLWVHDVASNLQIVRELVHKLDIPVKQVEIEARIVNIDKNYEKALGAKLGISNRSSVSGSLAGANQLRQGIAPENVPLNQRLNVNLPGSGAGGVETGTIGIALARLGRGVLLDLELSALEAEGFVEIVSSPRLVTANQREAFIEAGEEIPYRQSSSSGAASIAFKNAVLRLGVTPQITPDGRIILNLAVNQDKRGKEVAAGEPAIDTRKIETQVLTSNGETIVLGGIYERDSSNQIIKVPFLGDLPMVGRLFSKRTQKDNRKELIIFVTPRIIEQNAFNG